MTKTKRIQILCLLGAVALLLSGCWTEPPVESANGLLVGGLPHLRGTLPPGPPAGTPAVAVPELHL